MKKFFTIILAVLMLTAAIGVFADEITNKDEIMAELKKTVLVDHTALMNQVERILYNDALTISDSQKEQLLALQLEDSNLVFTDKGTNLYDYSEQEQELALDYLDRVCKILDITYTISPTNDSQSGNAVVISVYKDGKLLGKIDSDAKTDIADEPQTLLLVLALAAALIAVAVGAFLILKKRQVTAK